MKKNLILFFIFISHTLLAIDTFDQEARELSVNLKTSLVKNLTEKINKDGVLSAISFCNENVKFISKKAALELDKKYFYGRSSHKTRNELNNPKDWMKPIIEEYLKTTNIKNNSIDNTKSGTLSNGKKYFVEPLYTQTQCLLCHGENIANNLNKKINELYPNDKATGFKLNEFRGIIWIVEK